MTVAIGTPQGAGACAKDHILMRTTFVCPLFLVRCDIFLISSRQCRVIGFKSCVAGDPEPGTSERSAVIYTLLGSCRRQGLNPFHYLKDLFTRLPSAKIAQIREFTPAAWAEVKAKARVLVQAA